MKRKVVYIEVIYPRPLEIGARATVIPLNHPDTENVMNGAPCYTTPVIKINEDRSFETWNTLYVPMENLTDEELRQEQENIRQFAFEEKRHDA